MCARWTLEVSTALLVVGTQHLTRFAATQLAQPVETRTCDPSTLQHCQILVPSTHGLSASNVTFVSLVHVTRNAHATTYCTFPSTRTRLRSACPRRMQSPRAGDTRRPRTLHTSRSFTRLESPHRSNPASPTRIRASTIQTPVIKSIPELAHPLGAVGRGGDIFESTDDQDGQVDNDSPSSAQPELQHPETFEQLPIEIRSYAERCASNSDLLSSCSAADADATCSDSSNHYPPKRIPPP